MGVTGLDHVNIRTRDFAASAAFYTRLLGLTAEPPAGVPSPPARARWLYDPEGRAILHFLLTEETPETGGPLDHVALRCTGLAEMTARLEAADVTYRRFSGFVPGTIQLVLTDPSGVRLELLFVGE